MTETDALERLHKWVQGRIAGQASFKLPEIVAAAEVEFGDDAGFLRAFLGERMRAALYAEIQNIVARSRQAIVEVGGAYVNAGQLQDAATDAARGVWGRWSACYEHVDGRHVLVLDMKDKDLAGMEESRFRQAEDHAKWGRFARALRTGMKRGKKVRDCFSPTELDELWKRATGTQANEEVAAD